MEWWNDLWLNEGFASYVELYGVDDIHPEYHIWNNFFTNKEKVLGDDSSLYTHPVQVDVSDPGSIGALFDSITYVN